MRAREHGGKRRGEALVEVAQMRRCCDCRRGIAVGFPCAQRSAIEPDAGLLEESPGTIPPVGIAAARCAPYEQVPMGFVGYLRRNAPGDLLILLERCRIDRNRAGANGQQAVDTKIGRKAAEYLDVGTEYVRDGSAVLAFGQPVDLARGCVDPDLVRMRHAPGNRSCKRKAGSAQHHGRPAPSQCGDHGIAPGAAASAMTNARTPTKL